MKTSRAILLVFGIIILSVAPMLMVDSYKARKSRQEWQRMTLVESAVESKVEDFQTKTGHYPDSIAELSFTNSTEDLEIVSDLPKINYHRTPAGYAIGWDSKYGYHRQSFLGPVDSPTGNEQTNR